MRYPLHLDVAGRLVVVVGGGAVAARRVASLVEAGARVRVVAPSVGFPADDVVLREFAASDVEGAWLVHACTGVVDDDIAAACEAARVWCVRADDAALSPAWVPAVARADDVTVSVSAGRDPRRSVAVRDAVALLLDTEPPDLRRRRPGTGSVALVGGGPGDPGLLTVRGRQLLAAADVVVRDRLAPDVDVPGEVVEVGKSAAGGWRQDDITQLLVDRARAGDRVVRLKGGDVHVFARGIEDVAACVAAGVTVEVVPGVSSALAAPTLAGVPVTARGVNQSFTVVSAHLAPGDPGSTVDWDALARLGGTLLLLMAVERLGAVCAALVDGGLPPTTPVALVE
ncbi:MAG: uroporphyrinogen-III C-methyltransferase, partial [Frankiales bacterium]|nr:uroporphyrinogen-III C-methyltransferase [Frankiales bacterium]